jgi:hypothetical protein
MPAGNEKVGETGKSGTVYFAPYFQQLSRQTGGANGSKCEKCKEETHFADIEDPGV